MANLSQQKRERMLAFLETLKAQHTDDDSLMALGEIEKELKAKKYGLVWEEHEEAVDVMMQTRIPVFTEDASMELNGDPSTDRFNFLLEGDNLHSLRLLEKTHRGKIDVIYIDPPYNTGKKDDFTYDDQTVDDNDTFIHSKWLSFMHARLVSARRLLSENGVIVISIGYQEINDLMLLCNDLFDSQQVMSVTVQTSGGKPNGGFTLMHEYLVFITPREFSPKAMTFTGGNARSPFEGLTLSTFYKTNRPNQTYPIFIDRKTMHIVGVGKSLTERIKEGLYSGELGDFKYDYSEAPKGTAALWPISSKGAECVWRLIPERLLSDWEKGYIKVSVNKSKSNPNEYSIQYLPEGVIKKIESGELPVIGREDKMPTLILGENKTEGSEIPTIWTEKEFHTVKGTSALKEIFHANAFSYPKPLAFIAEIMRAVTTSNSTVLDFFAGSGTTGQAVMELNQQDGGKRKFILCTNNENGICENVTYQRLKTVITGKRKDGSTYSDGIPANLMYFRTDFVEKESDELSEELLEHIREMIQLEHGIKIDNQKYVIIMDDEEMDAFEKDIGNYPQLKAVFINQDVFLSSSQEEMLENIDTYIIPDYYFDFELREAGEIW